MLEIWKESKCTVKKTKKYFF